MKKKLSGIRLMAERLGVSTATISRALNSDTCHKVKEERRREILELADKMRYQPNPGARLIQQGHNSTLGVLIPSQEGVFFSEFYGRLLGGLIHAVSGKGWEVRINTITLEKQSVLDQFRRMGLGSSGLIYVGTPLSAAQVDELEGYYSPLILLSSALPTDYPLEKVKCHVLGVDNYNGAITAANYIVGLGHKRIGVILGPEGSRDFSEREKGYRDSLAKAGIELQEDMVFRGSYDQESGREGCKYFMAKAQMPTALICASDSIAFGVIDFAKERGLECPRDFSVIGFDDGPWAMACSPKLTTIHQPLDALTENAVAILASSIMDAGSGHCQRCFLSAYLKVRESTAPIRRERQPRKATK